MCPTHIRNFMSCCSEAAHHSTVAMPWASWARPAQRCTSPLVLGARSDVGPPPDNGCRRTSGILGAAQLTPSGMAHTVERMYAQERPSLFVRIYVAAHHASRAIQSFRLWVDDDAFSLLQAC